MKTPPGYRGMSFASSAHHRARPHLPEILSPRRLAAAAGGSGGLFEPLETRQMLAVNPVDYTLKVSDIRVYTDPNPANSLYRHTFSFAYFAPFYTELDEPAEDTPIYGAIVTKHIFGANISFIGPAGARIKVFDLAGNLIDERKDVFAPPGTPPMPLGIDQDDDGVPDFNYGIGRIELTGTTEHSSLTVSGFTVTNLQGVAVDAPNFVTSLIGAFQTGGFGYQIDNQAIQGLPQGAPATVIVGSPYLHPTSSGAFPFYEPPTADTTNFNRPGEGVFVNGGASMGSVLIDGFLYGSSQLTGACGRFAVSVMQGSLSVAGDLGTFVSASDAGTYFLSTNTQAQFPKDDLQISTGSTLSVGRTLQQMFVGGRNQMSVSVLGDINNSTRARLRLHNYTELEQVAGFDPSITNNPQDFFQKFLLNGLNTGAPLVYPQDLWRLQAIPFGTDNFRNNFIGGAEFVGYTGTSVLITGTIGGRGPQNTQFDLSDVYSFAADPSREVVLTASGGVYAKIVDEQGRLIAAIGGHRPGKGDGPNNSFDLLRFRPDHRDIYYLVVNPINRASAAVVSGLTPYSINLNGMAPVALGLIQSAGGVGRLNGTPGGADRFGVSVSTGSAGSIRVGTGYFGGISGFQTTLGNINTNAVEPDRFYRLGQSTINIANTLFNIWVGGDVFNPTVTVGENFGSFLAGQNTAGAGTSTLNGDLIAGTLNIGGQIGRIDLRGNITFNQLAGVIDQTGQVSIRTGTNPTLKGNIGQILVGGYIQGDFFTVNTSNGSQIDQFIVGTNPDNGPSVFPGQIKFNQPSITVGQGSDVRFVDFEGIDGNGVVDTFIRLGYGQTHSFVDDAGGSFTISITGGDAPAEGATTSARDGSVALIRVLPVNLSRGVAVARITATLRGGANLVISSTTNGVISIGHIIVDADYDPQGGAPPEGITPSVSTVIMNGPGEIDVDRIDVTTSLVQVIRNTTPGGDIVAIDANQLNRIDIRSGSLGRTQTSGAGPSLLGPFLGIRANRGGGAVGGPLGVDPVSLQVNAGAGRWSGAVYNQVNNPFAAEPTLEELGSPIDPYLNGVVVRNGDLVNVSVGGAVGDVIVEGNFDLVNLIANADASTLKKPDPANPGTQVPVYGTEGIVGSLYARRIGTVDIGDGLEGSGPSPLSAAGIYADQSIFSVFGATRYTPDASVNDGVVTIHGTIDAANNPGALVSTVGVANPVDMGVQIAGIGTISLGSASRPELHGRYDRAYIGSMDFRDIWVPTIPMGDFGTSNYQGSITLVQGTGADLFGSIVIANDVQRVRITGGAYDATQVQSNRTVGPVSADEFRNSTLLGQPGERYINRVLSAGSVSSVFTTGGNGDISDLAIDAGRDMQSISARSLIRVNITVNNAINAVTLTRDMLGTSFIAGGLLAVSVGRNIRSSTISIAGPVGTVTVGGEATGLLLQSTGPDGRLDSLTAQGQIQGVITSYGNIGAIRSLTSDILADIETRNDQLRPNNGGLTLLSAARDYVGDLVVLGDTGQITVGRNIGRQGSSGIVLDLRGRVANIDASHGQIYSDLVIGHDLTGLISIGRVSMRPFNDQVSTSNILAFGRINRIDVQGDLGENVTSRSGGIGQINITNGSFRHGHTIRAANGGVGSITITGGHLLGDVVADGDISSIRLVKGADGFVGHIGVAPGLSANTRWLSDIRNELPPGSSQTSGIDGALIQAGGSIGLVRTAGIGGMWESRIIAGKNIDTVSIGGRVRNDDFTSGLNNAIVAGDRIGSVTIGGNVGGLAIIAGARSLGADNAVGGTGTDADTIGPGSIGPVVFNGRRTGFSLVAAGISPDSSGSYNAVTSFRAPGRSSIESVTAHNANSVSALAAGTLGPTSAGITRGGATLPVVDPSTVADSASAGDVQITPGVSFQFITTSGEHGRIDFNGPGSAFWDPTLNRVRLLNTTAASSLVITPRNNGTLTDFVVLGNPASSLGTLSIGGTLLGNSAAYVNGQIVSLTLGTVDASTSGGAGFFGAGDNIGTLSVAAFLSGSLRGRSVGSLSVTGDFGRVLVTADAAAVFRSLSTATIGGALAGTISSDLAITSFTAGSVDNGGLRSGDTIQSLTVNGRVNRSRISARNSLGTVVISGNVSDSSILAGADLGTDAEFGGSGTAADTYGDGTIGSVTVGGNFTRSDIGAGVVRGPFGFLGLPDQRVAAGRSSIGSVSIAGNTVGSTQNSQQYRIISNGTIGPVTVNGTPFTSRGNFKVVALETVAVPIQVVDLRVVEDSRVYTAVITFNQAVDSGSLANALSIAEVRAAGATLIPLVPGTHYTLTYDPALNQALIQFSTNITRRDLVGNSPGPEPSPGVYRFTLDADVLRGSSQDNILDGDGDGVAGDDWARAAVVGDAGDRTTSHHDTSSGSAIDLYGPEDLDQIMQTAASPTPGAAPVTNTIFRIDGVLGDHPDQNATSFFAGADADVFRITLKQGQIFRVSGLNGLAAGAQFALFASGSGFSSLPVAPASGSDPARSSYIVTTSGTFYLAVFAVPTTDIFSSTPTLGLDAPSLLGKYSFTAEVFDDGDTGFQGSDPAGQAAPIVQAPRPMDFAGPNGMLGDSDDLTTIQIQDTKWSPSDPNRADHLWTFTLTPGAGGKNSPGTVIRGTNGKGWVSTRTIGANGRHTLSMSLNGSIGDPLPAGAPTTVEPDADAYLLNDGDPLAPGTRVRVTVRLSDFAGNFGLSTPPVRTDNFVLADLLSFVSFGLYEVTPSTGLRNAVFVVNPSDFNGMGSQVQKSTTDGRTIYGFNANGDFFLDFVVPPSNGTSSTPGSFAFYVQGAIRSSYGLDIVIPPGSNSTAVATQNILLETAGGRVDWLEHGTGLVTRLDKFSTSPLGFSGQVNGTNVDNYVLTNLVSALNTYFAARGISVNISLSAQTFQGQDFSTVFLAGNAGPSALSTLGMAQHNDPFNADRNDESVVFIPGFGVAEFDPSPSGVDAFVAALAGTVEQQILALLGRQTNASNVPFSQPAPASPPTPAPNAPAVARFLDTPAHTQPAGGTLASVMQGAESLDAGALLRSVVRRA